MKFNIKDFVYITIIITYYFFNVEVFDHTFKECNIIKTINKEEIKNERRIYKTKQRTIQIL